MQFCCIWFAFQFPGIQEACCQYLIRNLDSLNCLDIWEFADKYSLPNLSQECLAFAAKNIVDISKSSDFYNLSASNMTEVLPYYMYKKIHFTFIIKDTNCFLFAFYQQFAKCYNFSFHIMVF